MQDELGPASHIEDATAPSKYSISASALVGMADQTLTRSSSDSDQRFHHIGDASAAFAAHETLSYRLHE